MKNVLKKIWAFMKTVTRRVWNGIKKVCLFVVFDKEKRHSRKIYTTLFVFWMTGLVTSSIIEGKYEVAIWQFWYCVIFLLFMSAIRDVEFWRGLAIKAVELNDCAIELITDIREAVDGKTYKLVEKNGQQGILCLECGKVSYHPGDVATLYCANCKKFHESKKEI